MNFLGRRVLWLRQGSLWHLEPPLAVSQAENKGFSLIMARSWIQPLPRNGEASPTPEEKVGLPPTQFQPTETMSRELRWYVVPGPLTLWNCELAKGHCSSPVSWCTSLHSDGQQMHYRPWRACLCKLGFFQKTMHRAPGIESTLSTQQGVAEPGSMSWLIGTETCSLAGQWVSPTGENFPCKTGRRTPHPCTPPAVVWFFYKVQ